MVYILYEMHRRRDIVAGMHFCLALLLMMMMVRGHFTRLLSLHAISKTRKNGYAELSEQPSIVEKLCIFSSTFIFMLDPGKSFTPAEYIHIYIDWVKCVVHSVNSWYSRISSLLSLLLRKVFSEYYSQIHRHRIDVQRENVSWSFRVANKMNIHINCW